jgi:hypothetical protein
MLTKIDDLILSDHWYLESEDECYFLGEYTAGKGFAYSATNRRIFNLKKGMERRGLPDWIWKHRAIQQAASELRDSLNAAFLHSATFVPIPPSRTSDDPLYDDRMTQVLRSLGSGVDVRELVIQVQSMTGAHSSPDRPSPQQLYENYSVEYDLTEPNPSRIAVVDDVLTTGAHFKAMKRILKETFEDVVVLGLFLARRVPNTE